MDLMPQAKPLSDHFAQASLCLSEPAAVSAEAGHGPRHMALSPDNRTFTCSTSYRGMSLNMQSMPTRAR